LVEDKLQAVSFAPDNLTINYGSKEDDERALQTLSELLTSAHQTQESFASEILRSLDIFSKVKLLLLVYALDSKGVKYIHISQHCEPLVFCAG
jgi:ABC-type antimicrobial peptide transport system ATPase subunit